MRNLPLPDIDNAREQLTSALDPAKCGYATSQADIDSIVELYNAYDAANGSPSELLEGANLDSKLLSAILSGFDLTRRRSRLAMLRTQLMQRVEQCPICGIEAPRDLDHHLPKTKFKALAIYARNLVPLCTLCNQSKGSRASTNEAEHFIHPYFEQLPDARFLRANVEIQGRGLLVEYGVDEAAEMPDLLRQRINFQLQRVGLNERYARELNIRLINHSTALRYCFEGGGGNAVRRFLSEQAETEFDHFHANHWSPILLLALRGHVGFCEGAFLELLAVDPIAV